MAKQYEIPNRAKPLKFANGGGLSESNPEREEAIERLRIAYLLSLADEVSPCGEYDYHEDTFFGRADCQEIAPPCVETGGPDELSGMIRLVARILERD